MSCPMSVQPGVGAGAEEVAVVLNDGNHVWLMMVDDEFTEMVAKFAILSSSH